MSLAEMDQRLNDAALALEEARKHADEALTELIQASEEYQRAAQHLTAAMWVLVP